MEPVNNPRVIDHNPNDNQKDVRLDQNIEVEFSIDIDPDSLNYNTFVVLKSSDQISGDIEYDNQTATFIPDDQLEADSKYEVVLLGDLENDDPQEVVVDVTGNPLPENYRFDFSTTDRTILDSPQILHPSNKSIISDLEIEWTEVEAAENYSIEICTDTIFDDLEYTTTLIDNKIKPKDLKKDQEYFVRVKANDGFNDSYWSKVHSFYYESDQEVNTDFLTDLDQLQTENQLRIELIEPEDEIQINPNLSELKFKLNRHITIEELNDISIDLIGHSVNNIPYIEDEGKVDGSLEIVDSTEDYTILRYVI